MGTIYALIGFSMVSYPPSALPFWVNQTTYDFLLDFPNDFCLDFEPLAAIPFELLPEASELLAHFGKDFLHDFVFCLKNSFRFRFRFRYDTKNGPAEPFFLSFYIFLS